MSPANSLAEAHSSLYNALGIPQAGDIDCFAGRETQSQCLHTLPKRRRALIKPIVQALAVRESNDDDQRDTIDLSLRDLAKKLVCHRPEKIHTETLVFDGDKFPNPVDYAHALLTRRFYKWLKTESKENPRLVRSSQKSSTSLRERGAARMSKRNPDQSQCFIIYDTDDGEYPGDYLSDDVIESIEEDIDLSHRGASSDQDSEDEGIDECTRQTSTQRELRRPGLTRQSPLGDKEIPRTPPRNHGSRYRNIYSRSPGLLSYPTPTNDACLTSPGSVTSPDPSEVFTPYSTASTPYSAFSTKGCETPRSSFRQSCYNERHMESPTRRKMQTDIDLLSSDMMKKMRLSVDDLGDQSDEAESEAESLRSRRSMTFDDTEKSPVHNTVKLLARPVSEERLGSGYVYCFAERSKPGFLKIGYVRSPEFSKSDKVERRKGEWENECKNDLVYKFRVFMPHAVRRMEALIHQTLHRKKMNASCPNTACQKTHKEWFRIEEEEAYRVIEIWQQFSKLNPYGDKGELEEHWARYKLTHLDDECLWNAKSWLATEWAKLIAEAVEALMQEKQRAVEKYHAEMRQRLAVLRKAQERILI
ncbi:hypothetical protein FVEG_04090 [Fusarium verticillioides 7600]|uniref:Bacteriophage T5 Orf172 DNA-binding domain-containing protein n=1 Tax=Gibberella moniliformis (strain M3125 / FGSC 7600) TaxID=334819 RepID=W7M3S6_GIBM7|nr:hypothetical protein FVEG_04090 [Fusarium verticillioides 7600]XP_018748375.1 hypothetical protein FVEG_04090 [Fusarium verticillioides 7600]XP_018748376.1 hypothetical protein FVEG_04090 [Fusarium verticillioides 7600]RBR01008.1 hypothetical protein FVER53590_04090 [Fusarium verticillioides]EWG42183.1 hypothetical protein FVEG_04090 [Fusarium verticillioides 7600]EWG42184.1 hypothetical protein FVEG_04090 [Fusarium verticillioides 7600]EWG42185.1 hypothetical protein FVEG_04090 [Fusarium 